MIEQSELRSKLSCSLQDLWRAVPAAKPRQQNVLDPKLGCSLQADEDGVFGLAVAAVGDCAADIRDVPHDIAGRTRDDPGAISSGCRGLLGGIRDRSAISGGDTRPAAGVGIGLYCRRFVGDGKWKAEMNRGNTGNGEPGSSRLLSLRDVAGCSEENRNEDNAQYRD